MAETNQAATTEQAADYALELELGLRARFAGTLADATREIADHAPDVAVGAAAAVVVTAIGWLVAAALTLAVWSMAAPANGSYAAPLHVAGQLWLAAHHVLLQTPDGPFGLSPLGFTVLPVASLVLAGRYAARHFNAGIWSFAAVAACYPLTALTIAWSAAAGALRADLGAAAGYPCLIACCGFGAGLLSVRGPRMDRWAATAVRAGVAALAVLVVGAALLATVAVCVRFADVVRLGNSIGQGTSGDFGLFLIDLALVPNLVVWALGFAAGPGFAVGEGSSVTVAGSTHGALPGLPLMQAVPHSGMHTPWLYLVFLVPLAAGAVTVLIIGWSVRGLVDRVAALGTAVPAVGAVAGAGAVLSGGPVAAGAMSAVGPVPWQVALAVLGELAFVAVCGFGLWYAIDYGRGYIDRPREAVQVPETVHVPEAVQVSQAVQVSDEQHAQDAADDTTDDTDDDVLPGLDDDGLGDLVAPGLILRIPERPQEVQDAGDDAQDPEEPVQEEPQEAEPAADRLAVGEPGEADAHDPLAVGLAIAPGADGVDDGPDGAGQGDDAERHVD
jgi:hypothetical protein